MTIAILTYIFLLAVVGMMILQTPLTLTPRRVLKESDNLKDFLRKHKIKQNDYG